MHDCSKTKEDLVDLVFDELCATEKTRLLAQVQNCLYCRAELRAVEKTLDLYSQAANSLEPSNAEWKDYQTRLLKNFAAPRSTNRLLTNLQNFFSASIKIPVPAFVALILFVGSAFFLTVRLIQSNERKPANEVVESKKQITPAAPEVRIVEKPVEKTIEKIVIQKQIVTKTIRQAQQPVIEQRSPELSKTDVAKTQKSKNLTVKALNLSEFQSANQSTPVIVKGNSSNEK